MAITVNGKKVAGVGPAGLSPYQVAKAGGYAGTEADYNQQLVGLGDISGVLDQINGEAPPSGGGGTFTITDNSSVEWPESAGPGEYVEGSVDGVVSFNIVGDVTGKSIPWSRSGPTFAGVYSFVMPAENVTVTDG